MFVSSCHFIFHSPLSFIPLKNGPRFNPFGQPPHSNMIFYFFMAMLSFSILLLNGFLFLPCLAFIFLCRCSKCPWNIISSRKPTLKSPCKVTAQTGWNPPTNSAVWNLLRVDWFIHRLWIGHITMCWAYKIRCNSPHFYGEYKFSKGSTFKCCHNEWWKY